MDLGTSFRLDALISEPVLLCSAHRPFQTGQSSEQRETERETECLAVGRKKKKEEEQRWVGGEGVPGAEEPCLSSSDHSSPPPTYMHKACHVDQDDRLTETSEEPEQPRMTFKSPADCSVTSGGTNVTATLCRCFDALPVESLPAPPSARHPLQPAWFQNSCSDTTCLSCSVNHSHVSRQAPQPNQLNYVAIGVCPSLWAASCRALLFAFDQMMYPSSGQEAKLDQRNKSHLRRRTLGPNKQPSADNFLRLVSSGLRQGASECVLERRGAKGEVEVVQGHERSVKLESREYLYQLPREHWILKHPSSKVHQLQLCTSSTLFSSDPQLRPQRGSLPPVALADSQLWRGWLGGAARDSGAPKLSSGAPAALPAHPS
ncbi:unnamed protein product [Pleuronectes platessa]|uniref:Uncharacterized protein n=1 Tax=Pleuronectes platessa TaxID=8262 RepID=A0A9N7U6T8_PLEPL|nr:unnamed protein product [Pleuronectes platessa]